MTIHSHRGDLPEGVSFGDAVAIDTETMGLNPHRDRLCAVQLSAGDGDAHVVQILPGQREAPNLVRLLADPAVVKIFHYARFDVAVLRHAFGVETGPLYCTKIASRLTRTFTDRHGLKDLVRELTGVELSKQQQSSDWGADRFTEAQLAYAAPTFCTCMSCARSLTRCWHARGGRRSRPPASPSCRRAPASIC